MICMLRAPGRGQIDTVENGIKKYIFVEPMQLNTTAFYQIIDIQCMRLNLIHKLSSKNQMSFQEVSFSVFRT